MAVGITVGSITTEIGASSFVHAFFSTISAHCEPDGWGSRFPHLMNELYQGHLPYSHAGEALKELAQAKALLEKLPPSAVVWDIEDRAAQPPWGKNIAATIINLGHYFITSTGRDVFASLEEMLDYSAYKQQDATLA
jgi:hypothetical protein